MHLGYANVDVMLAEMNATQWLEWKAYMALNPFGHERLDHLFASIAQAIWNVQIAKASGKNQPKYAALKEFLLRFGDAPDPTAPTRNQTERQKWDNLLAAVKLHAKPKKDTNQKPSPPPTKDPRSRSARAAHAAAAEARRRTGVKDG